MKALPVEIKFPQNTIPLDRIIVAVCALENQNESAKSNLEIIQKESFQKFEENYEFNPEEKSKFFFYFSSCSKKINFRG